MPWYHLFPKPIYKFILSVFGEKEVSINQLLEIKDTGISIERLLNTCKDAGFKIVDETYWLFNPIYKYKFGLKPSKQFSILSKIPYIRNFYTTAAYIIIE